MIPFNPFVTLEDAFEDLDDAWNGLARFATDLGNALAVAGRDSWNAGVVVLSEMAATGGALVDAALVFGLRMAEQIAVESAALIADVWTDVAMFADATGDELGRQAAALTDALGEAWEDTTEAAEDAAEEAVEIVEEVAEEVVEVVEETVETVTEGADEVVDFVISLFS